MPNDRLDFLHPYPFERLRLLLDGVVPGGPTINLGIGEPQHPTPPLIVDALQEAMPLLGKYPPTAGTAELRESVVGWLARRYGVVLDECAVLPVAGTREALFGFAQAMLDPIDPGVVLMPNPFYQIYEGAALLAGAKPFYVPTPDTKNRLPDWSVVPAEIWPQVRLAYVCSPGNPTGAVLGLDEWNEVFAYADCYGFIVAADECYSEIYNGDPPVGALEAAKALGRTNERLVVFNSLSKRSSAPGLRSGFVAGDPAIIAKFLVYRTYHGAAPGLNVQAASAAAWNDETHVEESRAKYRAKFEAVRNVSVYFEGHLDTRPPEAGFFLWARVADGDDEGLARALYARCGITVLPGSYLGRDSGRGNPGKGYVRMALVPEIDVCLDAMRLLDGYFTDVELGNGPSTVHNR